MNHIDLDNLFTYHAPQGDQPQRYTRLRAAGRAFAAEILALTPPCADQTAAIRQVREAVFTANAAVACSPIECLPPMAATAN